MGLIRIGFVSTIGLAAMMWSGCGGGTLSQDATLTVTPAHVAAGGSVTVTWKTEGWLSSVGFTLTSNPPLSGFPIAWTGNQNGSSTWAITQTTTFTLQNVTNGGTTVISKTAAVP